MRLYIDNNKLNELEKQFDEIKSLFTKDAQNKMEKLLDILKKKGFCESKDLDNIYSILENRSEQGSKKVVQKENNLKRTIKEKTKEKYLIEVLNNLVLLLNLNYYFSENKTKENYVYKNKIQIQENKS